MISIFYKVMEWIISLHYCKNYIYLIILIFFIVYIYVKLKHKYKLFSIYLNLYKRIKMKKGIFTFKILNNNIIYIYYFLRNKTIYIIILQ